MKKYLKKYRIFIYLLVAIILIIIVSLFEAKNLLLDSEKLIAKREVENQQEKEEKYVKITFFHTSSHRGSISIPESWEGKYRKEETGDTVTFAYIEDSSEAIPIFTISTKKTNNEMVELKRIDDYKVYYQIYNNRNDIPELNKMRIKSDELIKTFKIF